jgi:hypothetical protein
MITNQEVTRNQGMIERVIRVLLGLALVWMVLYASMGLADIWKWTLTVVALLLIVTGISGICPLWMVLKINTNKK